MVVRLAVDRVDGKDVLDDRARAVMERTWPEDGTLTDRQRAQDRSADHHGLQFERVHMPPPQQRVAREERNSHGVAYSITPVKP